MRASFRIPIVLLGLVGLLLAAGCAESESPGVREIAQEGFLESADAGALILDVRTEAEFATSHVPGAVNIPHDQLGARLTELNASGADPVVVYCERGGRAGKAIDVLAEAGYTNLAHLEGDMSAWRAANRRVETGP